jgi:two-component system cell cycle sensor histidine kinase/response regulator CckA
MKAFARALRQSLAAVFFAASLLPLWSATLKPAHPSVVVLNSYHDGFVWSDEELQGLEARLREAFPGVEPRVEYLDTKRFSGEEQLKADRDFLVRKYAGFKADLVVALDNPALEMLLANPRTLFPGAPIVFAGVSDFSSLTVPAGERITGVSEVTDLAGTVRLALALHPDAKEMLLVADTTPSGTAVQRESEAVMAQFKDRLSYEFLPPSTFEEAAQSISLLPPDALLVILSYSTDRSGRSLSLSESTRLFTSHCPVPAFALHETRLGYGVVGGMMLSGIAHGRRAGDIAVRVLSGEDPSSIPVDSRGSAVPIFDYRQLQRFHIPLALLPRGSRIINRPVTVFSQYPVFSGVMTGIVTLLVAFACLLAASIFRRRETERELRASQANLRALLETTDDCFCSRDREGRLIAFNAAFARIVHDYAGIEVQPGMRFLQHFQPAVRHALEQLTGRCLAGRKASDIYEVDIRGERRFLEISVYPIREGKLTIGTVEFARDITERKRAEKTLRESEEQLLQARKMEAVGRLAGGITHDFNNLLTVIKAYSDMAIESREEGDALLEDLQQIQNAVKRAASLTSQLLAFSRRQVREPRIFNLNELIGEMTKMLGRVIGENIELCTSLEEGLWSVKADAAQVQQIIMNLVLNARDAMPMGGLLTIATANAHSGTGPAAAASRADGDSVVLTISDTGRGMDQETLSHLFEPFFTTKEQGKGTGLGLSTVYGFVQQSGGTISCASRPGEGTTFRILLPRAQTRDQEEKETPTASAPAHRNGSILIVEDEDAVRVFLMRTLSAAGYTVAEAKNGAAALETLRSRTSPCDLVLSDVVMPLMGGPELSRRVREEFPQARVLFISGYAGESLSAQGVLENGTRVLKKPFGPRELLDAVHEVLDAPSA